MNILERRKLKTELYDILKNLEVFDTKFKLIAQIKLLEL